MTEEATTLKESLEKFTYIGLTYYSGKYHDNVLNIFSDLTTEEKKIFLRGVYDIYNHFDTGIETQKTNHEDSVVDTKAKDYLVDYNSKVMVDVKVWFIKIFGIVLTLTVAFIFMFTLYVGTGISEDPKRLSNLFKIFGLLFN